MNKNNLVIILIIALLVAGFAVIFLIVYFNNSTPSENANQEVSSLDLDSVFSAYIEASKKGDLEKMYSLIYYRETSLNWINASEAQTPGMNAMLEEEVMSSVSNLEYTIKDREVEGDAATIIVGATKNGRIKTDAPFYFIKHNSE